MSASSSRATETVVLATKVGNRGQGPNSAAPQKLAAGHRPELDRLGTDYVDIYYLHKDFADAPLEETIEAMGDIVASGKARHFGVSNFRGWRIAEVVRLCGELGVAKPVACQPYYNAMNRQPEAEILPACHHYGIGVVPYRPLARGVLVASTAGEAPPPDSGRPQRSRIGNEFRAESLVMAQTSRPPERRADGTSSPPLGARNRIVSSVIGPATLEQWGATWARWGSRSSGRRGAVEALVGTGHPSTPGYKTGFPLRATARLIPAGVRAPSVPRRQRGPLRPRRRLDLIL